MHDFLLFGLFLYALTRLLSFSLPAYYTSEDLAAAIDQPTVIEADGEPIVPAKADEPFAQERFDFDAETDAEAAHDKDGEDQG